MAVWLYPHDPDLPGLARAAYPESMAALLNAYISGLGIEAQGDPARRPVITVAGRQRPLFAPRPPFVGYPPLGAKPLPYDQDFYADWLYALTLLIQGNVAGRMATEADIEQNRQLGQVLAALDVK